MFPIGGFPGFPGGTPGGGPGFPPSPPGTPPGGGYPGGGYPGGGQGPDLGGAPTAPPPSFVPQQQQQSPSLYAVDPGAIRGCLYRNTYVWLENGRSFWFYPTYVGRTSVAGYRWRRSQRRWVYYGTDLSRISSFRCSGF
ncbi:hypothetical protein LS684_19810 [Cytobacillus spongiae]|nr:hypothetical protein [Cytobacillus spongiae]UII58010.1 hypothetical protein LS684_19810 [Cytobacillus spongiae]